MNNASLETACQCVDHGHPAIPGHFPGHPVVPGVVLLSFVEQALRRQLGASSANLAGLAAVKFLAPLPPGQPFMIHLKPAAADAVRFEIRQDARLIAFGNVRLQTPAAFGATP